MEILNEISTIYKLVKTPSKNTKLKILKENYSANLEELLKLAFDPFIVFGLKKIDYVKTPVFGYNPDEHIKFVELCEYCSTHNTDTKKRDKVVAFLNRQTLPQQSIYHDILIKKLRIGMTAQLINRVYKNCIPTFKLMLASARGKQSFDEKNIVQEKLDGVRCVIIKKAGKCKAFTRSGKPIHLKNMFKELEKYNGYDNYVLDGELFVESRTKTTSVTSKLLKGNTEITDEALTFCVFDFIEFDEFSQSSGKTPLYERLKALEVFFMSNDLKHFSLVKPYYTTTKKQVVDLYDSIVKSGGEGVVVKVFDSPYAHKRSTYWIKLKQINTCSLQITNTEEGKGKFKGMLGALEVSTSDGKIVVSVGTGLTDKDRKELWEVKDNLIGKIIEIQYNELQYDKEGKAYLFLPVYVEVRIDKDTADTYEIIEKEFKSTGKSND